MLRVDVAVVGGGMVGLAHAYIAARQGLRVAVIDQDKRLVGSSVRNFGVLGFTAARNKVERELCLLSRGLWRELLAEIGAWHRTEGSMYIILGDEELEFAKAALEAGKRLQLDAHLISPEEVIWRCPPVRRENLRGGLVSPENIMVDPAEVCEKLAHRLREHYGVEFIQGGKVTGVADGYVGNDSFTVQADRTFLCTNTDFQTLFADQYREAGLQLLKLQMLRCRPRDPNWRIGPMVHGVFSLLRYTIASQARPFPALFERLCREYPDYVKYGIQGVVSQLPNGDVIIGDSHEELGDEPEVGRAYIERMIQDCVELILDPDDLEITDRWVGYYAKPMGCPVFRKEMCQGVTSVIVPGGMGLTLSLGAAYESLQSPVPPGMVHLK